MDVSRIRELGWRYKISLEEGIKKLMSGIPPDNPANPTNSINPINAKNANSLTGAEDWVGGRDKEDVWVVCWELIYETKK